MSTIQIESEKASILVIGMAGRIGSGVSFVTDKVRQSLNTFGYEVEVIKATTILTKLEQLLTPDEKLQINEKVEDFRRLTSGTASEEAIRVRRMQLIGNWSRRSVGNEIVAAFSISFFIAQDIEAIGSDKRKAYIVDSIKHPEEVRYLRSVFGDQFWMIGVVASDRMRLRRLKQRKKFSVQEFDFLSQSDIDGSDEFDTEPYRKRSGQNALKAVLMADYFFANDFAEKADIEKDAGRLAKLMFGIEVVSPTAAEVGMSAAYQASLRSACLSRQVGAAIVSAEGELISTGWNDVPKFGGGLYGAFEGTFEGRCWSFGAKCYNDEKKSEISNEVVEQLIKADILAADKRVSAMAILANTRISQLIEFSRAVHAEMEALLAIARTGRSGMLGSTMYVTTFPCHNCAKHIVDAGIRRVVYLEPYEKSLARELHPDSINDPLVDASHDKVVIEGYGGVTPKRFNEFFVMRRERKKDGKFLDNDTNRWMMPLIQREDFREILRKVKVVAEAYPDIEQELAAEDAKVSSNEEIMSINSTESDEGSSRSPK
ncbi:anti-phage dCTP deaminase [Lacunimicrobium album]